MGPRPMAEDDAAAIETRNKLFGEDAYREAGSPLFTQLWTHDELKNVVRRGKSKKNQHDDFVRPDNWPPDTEPERGTWVFWLPDGWAQGIRTQAKSGKQLGCYMNPDGKRFWHKKDIEKFLGRELPKMERPPEPEDGEKTKVTRYVTDPDAIPHWPDDEDEDWLPKDFKIAYRQLPSGLHRIYVPPGYENEGFLYHRATVMSWLAGETTTVSPFNTSKPIHGAASEELWATPKKVKLMDKRGTKQVLDDFLVCDGMRVVLLEGPLDSYAASLRAAVNDASGAPDIDVIAGDAQRLSKLLETRGFEGPVLACVFFEAPHPRAEQLSGFYYRQTGGMWNDQPIYRGFRLEPKLITGVACSATVFSWSTGCAAEGRWKLGNLAEGLAGCLALSASADISGKWMLSEPRPKPEE